MGRKKVFLASTAIIVGLFSSDMIGQANRPLISEAQAKWKTPCQWATGGALWGWFPCPIFDGSRMADEVQRTLDENLKLGSLVEQLQAWQKTLGSVTGSIAQVRSLLNSLFSFGSSAGPLSTFKDDGKLALPQVMAPANPMNVPQMSKAVADFYMRPGAATPTERVQLSRSVYSDGLATAVAAKSVVTKNQDEIKKLSEEIASAKTLRDDFVVNAKIRLTLLQALDQRNRLVARLTSSQAADHLRRMGDDPIASSNSWGSGSNAYGNPQAYANSVEQEAQSPEAVADRARSQAQEALNAGRLALNYAVELHNGLITGTTLNESIQIGGGSQSDYLRTELQTLSQRYGAPLDTPQQVQAFIGKLVSQTRQSLRTASQIIERNPGLRSDTTLLRSIALQKAVLENQLDDKNYQSYISANPNVFPSSAAVQ